ncbi:hypothetical protein Avbf_14622 [Armadillidium vulgare]|nr:hypothetical protein Avbf_14622 [Armadillidium vulgare]
MDMDYKYERYETLYRSNTDSYVNMNIVYKQMNEEWLSRHEDYLDMVISPDFQNLQVSFQNLQVSFQNHKSPMSEEGVFLGPSDTLNTEQYIAFLQSQSENRPIVDGGYLDVKFVRKENPNPQSALKALSTQVTGTK